LSRAGNTIFSCGTSGSLDTKTTGAGVGFVIEDFIDGRFYGEFSTFYGVLLLMYGVPLLLFELSFLVEPRTDWVDLIELMIPLFFSRELTSELAVTSPLSLYIY
jgi:hypothetical protein